MKLKNDLRQIPRQLQITISPNFNRSDDSVLRIWRVRIHTGVLTRSFYCLF